MMLTFSEEAISMYFVSIVKALVDNITLLTHFIPLYSSIVNSEHLRTASL